MKSQPHARRAHPVWLNTVPQSHLTCYPVRPVRTWWRGAAGGPCGTLATGCRQFRRRPSHRCSKGRDQHALGLGSGRWHRGARGVLCGARARGGRRLCGSVGSATFAM